MFKSLAHLMLQSWCMPLDYLHSFISVINYISKYVMFYCLYLLFKKPLLAEASLTFAAFEAILQAY